MHSCTRELIKHTAENTIWAKRRKYKMGQKQKMHAESTAGNTSGPHDESQHGGGRRPPHIMWPASICRIRLRMHFLLLPHIVFSAVGSYYIVFLGRLGIQIHIFQLPCTQDYSFLYSRCTPVVAGSIRTAAAEAMVQLTGPVVHYQSTYTS